MGTAALVESGLRSVMLQRSAIDGMADCAASGAPLSSPAPSAPRCAAAGLDSGTPAERLAFMPFDGAVDRLKSAKPRMGSAGDRPQRAARPSLPQLVGNVAQRRARLGPIRLQEGLAQRRRHHALLGLGDIGEGIAHPMHAAALPTGGKDPPDRCFQPFMGVGDDQLHATQPAPRQALQKSRPEGLGLRGADVEPDDLAPTVGIGRYSDYCGDRNDAAALALLQVSGVEPQIRPLAGEPAVEEGMDALVDVLAQLGNLRLADPRQPHRLHQIVDPSGRDAADPGLLDHRDQRLLRALAGFEKRRELAALPQLRDAQLQRAEPRVEGAVAVAVAPGGPLAAALVTPGADNPLDVALH